VVLDRAELVDEFFGGEDSETRGLGDFGGEVSFIAGNKIFGFGFNCCSKNRSVNGVNYA